MNEQDVQRPMLSTTSGAGDRNVYKEDAEGIMKTAVATLKIELYVECPHCENVFDLLTDTSLNDDGFLIKQAISDDRWAIPAEDRIECEPECPECKKTFNVKGLEW